MPVRVSHHFSEHQIKAVHHALDAGMEEQFRDVIEKHRRQSIDVIDGKIQVQPCRAVVGLQPLHFQGHPLQINRSRVICKCE